ncbi:COMM domain-containing protein 4 isoform X1 [Leptidea sinapis]|uniref:COMM domain-containing protein 4 isoform X1 n=1 Tax=Leptidea sinapis TaxID=189913 RepID=UPI00211F9C7F|nr:COMM domain-containing protein 4 isoform X1 [Leptidea sinapis]
MKFKFCDDGDCPLWALSALHALGSLPAAVFRGLLHRVLEEQPDDDVMDILKNSNLSSREEAARACGAVRWTLRQAQRSACGGVQLARDLLVLGVPRAHAAALAEAADGTRAAYEASVRANGFMINKVSEVSASPAPEGSINAVQLTITSNEVFAGEQNTDQLLIDRSQVNNLLQQLKTAYQKMEDIDFE